MQQDKLESYIREHREAFDDQAVPAGLWPRVEAGLGDAKAGTRQLIYWQAAAVIFLVLFLGLLIRNYQPGGSKPDSYATLDPEFRQTEQYYQQIIQEKENLLSAYLAQYPELATDFKSDLQELHQNYQKLKADLDKTNSAEVLNALILNLQLQQDLLNNQLKIIHLIEKENNDVSI